MSSRVATPPRPRGGVFFAPFPNTVAADAGELDRVREAVRRKLAWEGIVGVPAENAKRGGAKWVGGDEQLLKTLTVGQIEDGRERAKAAALGTLKALRNAWSHVLYPIRDEKTEPGRAFRLEWLRVHPREHDAIPAVVWEKVAREGIVKEKLGKENLRRILGEYWAPEQPHLEVREVIAWFRSYAYLPKLRDRVVLEAALSEAAADLDPPFAWAEAVEADGSYRGLRLAKALPEPVPETLLLVRPEVARELLPEVQPTSPPARDGAGSAAGGGAQPQEGTRPTAEPRKPTRFFGSVELDSMRPIKHFEQILTNVVEELRRTPGVKVTLRLEIDAEAANGFAEADMGVVRDNAKALKFRPESTGFSD